MRKKSRKLGSLEKTSATLPYILNWKQKKWVFKEEKKVGWSKHMVLSHKVRITNSSYMWSGWSTLAR